MDNSKDIRLFDLSAQGVKKQARELNIHIKKPYFFWSSFWLLVTSLVYTFILWNFGNTFYGLIDDLFLLNKTMLVLLGLICLLVIAGLLEFFVDPRAQLNRQRIHEQPSWVFYTYWGIINAFILCFICSVTVASSKNWFWTFSLLAPLLIILLKGINEHKSQDSSLAFKHFAAGAVGEKDDKLGFRLSAKHTTSGLLRLRGYVNVVGLYGGLGFGKSSYSRMILENFDPKKTLYTYISLTETNEAKDFSSLFAERWMDTLSERYPKIDITSYLPFMDSILRESGNGIFSEILKVISILDRGLTKTRAVFFDKFYAEQKSFFASARVSKLFANISEVEEGLWIIMVDEIERAQFDEIYRLVEIVERFKNEGRSGLPTKLLFLFCISEEDLSSYLDSFARIDSRAKSLKTFFYESKSIDYKIFIPPVDPAIKQKYVINQLKDVMKREGIHGLETISPHSISDPTSSFMNHKDANDYLIAVLGESSPRVINRIVNALDFFFGSFRNRAGVTQKNSIRFNDIVALEYIKIKFPFLIDFFIKTNNVLVNQAEAHNMEAYFLKEDLKKNKIDLIGWIELVTERKFSDAEKPEILKMVGLVMYYYFDFLNGDHETKNKIQYYGSTSYPEIMNDYLSLVSEGTETNYRNNNQFYQKHTTSIGTPLFQKLENRELTAYSHFLYSIDNAPLSLNIDLIQEIGSRLLDGRVTLKPLSVGDTPFDDAIYQFIFQIAAAVEKDQSKNTPDETLNKIFITLKNVLTSPSVNIGAKYIILNSFANDQRGSDSSIHFRLQRAFEKLRRFYDKELMNIIKMVFKDAENRYFSGEETIYEKEENFFFTLYQSWSGSKDSKEEIEKIRAVARRGLEKYPEAIKLYWDRFPIKEGWRDIDDLLRDDHFFFRSDANSALYMPLETLILATKMAKIEDGEIIGKMAFWEGQIRHPRVKDLLEIKDDPMTLKAVLIKRNFL